MKWKKWLENWDMTSLRIKTSFLDMEWQPQTADQDAAWELYIELLTRVTTQDLADDCGDEEQALASIYKIFDLTREIIKKYKRDCMEFTKISVVILNQILRPFTSKWHKIKRVAKVFKNLYTNAWRDGRCRRNRGLDTTRRIIM